MSRRMLAVTCATAFILGCGKSSTAGTLTKTAEQVTVPELVGQSMHAAQCLLVARDLRWSIDGAAPGADPDAPCEKGVSVDPDPLIEGQSPPRGARVYRNTTVTLQSECNDGRGGDPCEGMVPPRLIGQ